MAKAKQEFKDAAEYLESVGLEPSNIAQSGLTDQGYYEYKSQRATRVWHNWPSPEIGPKVIQLMYGSRT